MNVILWMWVLAPCFLAFVCAGLVFGLAEILQMRRVLQRMGMDHHNECRECYANRKWRIYNRLSLSVSVHTGGNENECTGRNYSGGGSGWRMLHSGCLDDIVCRKKTTPYIRQKRKTGADRGAGR
ncbi:hypothetical protein D6387_26530 [Salmonella enterica subsp. enterica serovar Cerro]|nr:hypothetical protein [Salmonella enterica subsp. enterica serovar Cerro]